MDLFTDWCSTARHRTKAKLCKLREGEIETWVMFVCLLFNGTADLQYKILTKNKLDTQLQGIINTLMHTVFIHL